MSLLWIGLGKANRIDAAGSAEKERHLWFSQERWENVKAFDAFGACRCYVFSPIFPDSLNSPVDFCTQIQV